MTKLSKVALLLLPLVLAPAARADDPVTVTRKPPTTHTEPFDPKSPPPGAHLSPDEAAFTRSGFLCQAGISYQITTPPNPGPNATSTIRIESVNVELSLDNTLFLPTNASKKLTAHEEAHRQIAETVYQTADKYARALAAPLVGKTFTVTGPDPAAAARPITQKLMQKLCDDYMNTAPSHSSTVNAIFDKITDHGRNKVPEADAIRQSFRKFEASTRPAQLR